MRIRMLVDQDRGALDQIIRATGMFTESEINVALELIDICLTQPGQQDYFIHVAESDDGEVVGYVCFGPVAVAEGTYDLYWIVVSPTYQGRKIGKHLLQFAEDQVRRIGGRLMIIETSSQEKYAKTQKFYVNNGYVEAARITDYYRTGDDRLMFVKYFNLV